ncbi:head maturation protease, ClpP-related [Achromobacter animicus]|uniref:head maturation protease, ClpP-related n=1 Tax=Achromobacter animicus TaxID=1389935 RepID=UPI0028A5B8D8|nr:head maturation protease, ClpP-related [Achromobacter animicus]
MGNKSLPAAPAVGARAGVGFELSARAMESWRPSISVAATDKSDASITILEPIGADPWTGEGVTARRISAALRSIGGKDVDVLVNSPGGSLFEGLAIYSLLREYEGKVTVKILGIAASAASFIAMAADEIQIARSGFYMIHNGQVWAAGDRNALVEVAEWLKPFDASMADIYAQRTGLAAGDVAEMMNRETWLTASDAIEQGFADGYLASDPVEDTDSNRQAEALHRVGVALAKQGMPLAERRKVLNDLQFSPRISGNQPAVSAETMAALQSVTDRFGAAANV